MLTHNLDHNTNSEYPGPNSGPPQNIDPSSTNLPQESATDLRRLALRLDRPATPQAQIEIFERALANLGISTTWQSTFQRIDALDLSENGKITVWTQYPNFDRKRIQEFATIYPDLTVPEFQKIRINDRYSFRNHTAQIFGSAISVIFSPSEIPQGLFEGLGILDFASDKRRPADRIERCNQLSAVLALKLHLDAAKLLDKRHRRMMVIDSPTVEVRAWYPDEIKDPDPKNIGKIFVFSERPMFPPPSDKRRFEYHFRPLRVAIYDDIYSVFRSRVEINIGYRNEARRVGELKVELQRMNRTLNLRLREGTPTDEKERLKEEARALYSKAIEYLERSIDRDKSKAREYLDKALTFKDSLGRDNESIAIGHLARAAVALEDRLTATLNKGTYTDRDLNQSRRIIELRAKEFKDYRKHLISTALKFTEGCYSVRKFKNGEMTPQQLLDKLNIEPPLPEKVLVNPFRTFATKMWSYYSELKAAIEKRDIPSAQKAFVKIYVVSKFNAANHVLEAVKLKVAMPPATTIGDELQDAEWILDPKNQHRPTLKSIQTLLRKLNTIFDQQRVYPNLVVEGFEDPFRQARSSLAELMQLVDGYVKAKPSGSALDEAYLAIRKAIVGDERKSQRKNKQQKGGQQVSGIYLEKLCRLLPD